MLHQRRRKVLGSCVTPAYMNELETTALTEKQHDKVQVCGIQSGKNTRVS